jgi:proline iminopeptidase
MAGLPPVSETYLSVGDDRLHVREIGHGRPIIILHGGPDFDHGYLLPELGDLGDAFRGVFYDQRGRGRSFSPERRPKVTLATEVADLDEVRAWTGSSSVGLLGHSWGGLLAIEYAIRHPDRVEQVILMSPAPVSRAGAVAFRRELAARKTPAQLERMRELKADPAYQRGDLEADAEYYRIHFGTTLGRPDQLEEIVGRLRRAFTPEAIVTAREIEESLYAETWSLETFDLIPFVRSLRIPTLIIHGRDDFIPLETARELAAAIPDASLRVIDACGHFAYLERRHEVIAMIAEFLSSGGASGTGPGATRRARPGPASSSIS